MQVKLLLSAILIVIGGCDSDKQVVNEKPSTKIEQKSEQQSAENNLESGDSTDKYQQVLDYKKKHHKERKTRSVSINGEKYLTEDAELITGSKVFNLLMKEYGRVKDSIVIVSNTLDESTLKQRYTLASVTKLAKDTYRLYPQDKSAIYELYKELAAVKAIQTVELEIDFSGEKPQQANY